MTNSKMINNKVSDIKIKTNTDRGFLYFTVPIVILMALTSSIGILYQDIYS